MMTIKLYQNISPREKVRKTLVIPKQPAPSALQGYLRDETSLIDPVLTFEIPMANIVDVNYLYIEDFKRYYYITHLRSIRTGLVEVSCHVDVLMSFQSYIEQQEAIVLRQEGVVKYDDAEHPDRITGYDHANLYINDGFYDMYQDTWTVHRDFVGGTPFQNNGDHSYVLMMTGVTYTGPS